MVWYLFLIVLMCMYFQGISVNVLKGRGHDLFLPQGCCWTWGSHEEFRGFIKLYTKFDACVYFFVAGKSTDLFFFLSLQFSSDSPGGPSGFKGKLPKQKSGLSTAASGHLNSTLCNVMCVWLSKSRKTPNLGSHLSGPVKVQHQWKWDDSSNFKASYCSEGSRRI